MNTLGIIPVRGGSKGLPRKNILPLAGQPLMWWTLDAAYESKLMTHVVVSSDSEEILDSAKLWHAKKYSREDHPEKKFWFRKRPDFLAEDETSTEAVMGYVIEDAKWNNILGTPAQEVYPDLIVLMQATSPLRAPEDIDNGIQKLLDTEADSLVSVVEGHAFVYQKSLRVSVKPDAAWWEWECVNFPHNERPRRQDMRQMQGNGSFWVFTIETWKRYKNRLGGNIEVYEMSKETAIQVDDANDLQLIEMLIMGEQWTKEKAFPRRIAV